MISSALSRSFYRKPQVMRDMNISTDPPLKGLEKTRIRPEIELVLCCARTHLDVKNIDRIKSLVQKNIDWKFLIHRANYHKVLPLLYTNLKAICPEAVPTSALDTLFHAFQVTAQYNMLLAGELARVLSWLGEHKIVAVPYKGPVLANSLYANIALRPSSDLDILVLQQDVLTVKDLLLTLGYRPKLEMTYAQEVAYLNSKTEHTYDFLHPDKGTTIELHWRIEPRYSTVIEPQHFWHNLELTSFAGITIANLPLEDWLPILCVHASRHIWERLVWLCDVAELLQSHPNINWQRMMRQANQLGYRRILLVGLCLAHRLLEANLPPEIMQEIAADRQVDLLVSKICQNFVQGIDVDEEFLSTTFYQIQVRERLQDKVLYFRSFLHWLRKGNK
jgi:hypothetical protein